MMSLTVPLDVIPSRLHSIPVLVSFGFLVFVARVYLNYRSAVKVLRCRPDVTTFFHSYGLIANTLPYIPGITVGKGWVLRWKHKGLFAESGQDAVNIVSLYPRPAVHAILADPLAIKEVTMSRARFPKPTKAYGVLALFGQNIVVTEGDEWKIHRRVAAPVFSERNNRLVWEESVRVTLDMFDSWGTENSEVIINHAADISILIALVTICNAGFGRRIRFREDREVPAGHKLSFMEAIQTVSKTVWIKIIAPRWMFPFSKTLRQVQLAFDELELYMTEMHDERKSSVVKEERYDLFSALLEAAEGEDGVTLSPRDIIGNIFIFLIAGHETTAHTLAFAMGFLALEQDAQERMYQNITSVVPKGEIPRYEHMNSLNYVLAVFYEALRLIPSVTGIPKQAEEDSVVPIIRHDGSKGTFAIQKGVHISISTPGLHYNPRYWPDPERFMPERFLGDWNRDAFLPFSGGPRACLGRKFAETEVVAFLTLLVRKYRIELRDPETFEGLTHAEKREKLLANRPMLTVTPLSVPLVFKRR